MDLPPSLFNRLMGTPPPTPQRRGRTRAPKAKTKRPRAESQSAPPPDPFLPLVARDGLYVRLVPPPGDSVLSSALLEAKEIFARAFLDVWQRVPGKARQVLRDRWQWLQESYLGQELAPLPPSGAIFQVVETGSFEGEHAKVEKSGNVLSFATGMIIDEPGGLALAIARALAKAYRAATEVDDRMIEELEKEFDRWLREEGASATDEEQDRFWDWQESVRARRQRRGIRFRLYCWGFRDLLPPRPQLAEPSRVDVGKQ